MRPDVTVARSFTIRGTNFTCREPVDSAALDEFQDAAAGRSELSSEEAIALIDEVVIAFLEPGQEERWRHVRRLESDPIILQDIEALISWLFEQILDRVVEFAEVEPVELHLPGGSIAHAPGRTIPSRAIQAFRFKAGSQTPFAPSRLRITASYTGRRAPRARERRLTRTARCSATRRCSARAGPDDPLPHPDVAAPGGRLGWPR
jgi:hypothetical protein